MISNRHILWAPDIVIESNGIACGDLLLLSAYREKNKLYFRFNGNVCKIALRVVEYLETTFSGSEEFIIKNNIERLRNRQYKESERWMVEYITYRKDCVESPISLLYGIIGKEIICDIDKSDKVVLACDACVSTKPINWKLDTKKKKKANLRDIIKEIKNIDDPIEIEFQKLGLCILTEESQKNFIKRFENITKRDFELVKKLRLATLLLNNARKYSLCLDSCIEELAVKQMVSLNIASEEIKIVDEYIRSSGLKINSVKGSKINQFYPFGYARTHMDFDYLAGNFDDAYKLILFLINDRKFKLVVGGSVPFSLKCVLNMNGEEVLTGHIHLEKILQDRYQVIVDINIGGFPLGRTGIVQCNNEGKVEIEDLICITISHLFKHEHAFIKDINDLYYLLSTEELDKVKLNEKLRKYELTNLFFIVYTFLKRHTDISDDFQIMQNLKISKKIEDAWPFSRKAHFYIKAMDMLMLNIKQYGEKKGKKETINQICGIIGEIATTRFYNLTCMMNERVYLYPVAIFKKYIYKLNHENLISIAPNIMRYNQLLILPIGIFLIQNGSETGFSREQLNNDVVILLKYLGLDETMCNPSYVMEARKDTWLY